MRIMGLDVGSKTVGVAVSDPLGFTAQGLEIIQIDEDKKEFGLERLAELVAQYKVTITYDFEAMDVKKAEGMTYFKNNHLPELLKLTPRQFADNLINAGASEQK